MRPILAALVIGLAWPAVAAARELSTSEQRFIAITTSAPIVAGMCGSQVNPASFLRIADSLGVDDGKALFNATLAAMSAIGKQAYNHEDLIPAVTRLVGEVADTIAADLSEGKPAACVKYLKSLRQTGAVE